MCVWWARPTTEEITLHYETIDDGTNETDRLYLEKTQLESHKLRDERNRVSVKIEKENYPKNKIK